MEDVRLPELPEPAREAEEACASWRNASPDYFTADQMRAYGAECASKAVEAEREKTKPLLAALGVATHALDEMRHAHMNPRWFTQGERGATQQFLQWHRKASDAIAAAIRGTQTGKDV